MELKDFFDMNKPFVYFVYTILTTSLFFIGIRTIDLLFIMLNVVLYVVISTTIFYTTTRYEESDINKKYFESIMMILYDTNKSLYDDVLKEALKYEPPIEKRHSFLTRYSTGIIFIVYLFISFLIYAYHYNDIRITDLFEGIFHLFALGLTEAFIVFMVMKKIPYPDITGLIDVTIQKKEKCTKDNMIMLSGGNKVTCSHDGKKCSSVLWDFECDEFDKLKVNKPNMNR